MFNMRILRFGTVWSIALIAAMAVGGCSRSAMNLDKQEERDPLLRRARALRDVQNIDGALEVYNKALDRKPTLARAHLEVGLLYDTEKQDYIRAIYHYQRYLELRPEAEKRKLIEDLIRQARFSFAASLPVQPAGAIEEIALLKREISMLKGELAAQHKREAARLAGSSVGATATAGSSSGASAAQPVVKLEPKPEPARPAVEMYVVQPRDTLSSIAAKMYKDPNKWKAIYDANRNTLPNPESVRVGQTLVIPR